MPTFSMPKAIRFLPVILWWVAFFAVLGWKPDFAYNAQRYFEWLLLGSLLLASCGFSVRVVFGKTQASLFFLLLALALWVAHAAPNGWLATRYLLDCIAMFLAVMAVAKTRSIATPSVFDRAAMIGILCLCFGASLIVLEGLLVSLSIHQINSGVVFAAFINVRAFSGLQMDTLLLLPAAWVIARSGKMRWWVSVTAAVWWCWLLFSGTRTALVVLPWALLVLFLCAGKSSLFWFKQLGVQLFGGVALFVLLRWLLSAFHVPYAGDVMKFMRPGAGTSGRFEHWLEAWQHFLLHPWLGNGPGAYACFTRGDVATPHNVSFMLLSEWGMLVTLLTGVIALWAFIVMARRLRAQSKDGEAVEPERHAVMLSLGAAVVAIISAAQFQGILFSPLSQMAVILVFGWAWHAFSPQSFILLSTGGRGVGNVSFVKEKTVRWLQCTLVIALLAIWLVMAKYDLALQKRLLILPDGTINLSYAPRYWAEGHSHCPAWHQRHDASLTPPVQGK
jgi:hypothetical protein